MSMTYNAKTGDYVVITSDDHKAQEVGLTLSTSATGPKGEPVYFTQVPYAALSFYDEADDRARSRLDGLKNDYARSWLTEYDISYPAPPGLGFYGYQNAGIGFGLEHHNVLIGDEPGLGKSGQAIGIANHTGAEKVLVICPASIRLNWQKEIKKWSTLPQPKCFPIMRSSDGVATWANYYMVSYELCRNEALHEALCAVKWDQIIIDEAHAVKTPHAQRTYAIFGGGQKEVFKNNALVDRAERVVALTGTPLPNRPRECFTLAKALNWESIDWMSYDDFEHRFNPSGMLDNGHVMELRGRLPELQARLRCNFMIRRLKSDVLKDLPEKQYEFSYIEADGAVKEVLRREKMLNFRVSDLKDPRAEIWGQISTLRREMGEAKLPRAIDWITYLLDIEELPKVVVFSHHRSVMDAFKARMNDKYGVVEVRGGMSSTAKNKAVEQFVNDPKTRIFHGQLEAAGFGIDGLQKVCQHVVFIEAAWTPGTNEQAVDRCHRIGQRGSVLAQFLVVEGSLDEKVLATVLNKTQTIHASLDANL